MRIRARALGLSIVCVALAGCRPDSSLIGQPLTCEPTTDSVQQTIFVPRCATGPCHNERTRALFLDLASSGVVERLAGVPSNGCGQKVLLVPGDPDASYLLEKLAVDLPTCGIRMPQGLPPLSEAEMACLRTWIAQLPPAPVPDGSVPDAGIGMDATSPCPTGEV